MAVGSPASWGGWGKGLCKALGFDHTIQVDSGDRRFHLVGLGIPVVGGEVFEPCGLLLAPEVLLVFAVPPGGKPRWACTGRPGWSAPLTYGPLDEAVAFAKEIYGVASSPRRCAMKEHIYRRHAEQIDLAPFVGAYFRALAECGPYSRPPKWDVR